jgi:hypothetical protein
MSTVWTAIGGIAALLVAGGTLTLAWYTHALAKQTHELASKTKDQVDASLREAKATEELAREARTDRLLAWQPQLEIRNFIRDGADWCMTVRNTGGGPALDVVVVVRNNSNVGEWALLRFGDLRPGEAFDKKGETWANGMAIISIFEDFLEPDNRRAVSQVMMCSDILGRRFRFGISVPINPFPGESSRVLAPEISIPDPSTGARLSWASEQLIWG